MTITQPLVSCIVPVFNVEQYVEETIRSVLMQTYPEWELILIDDGSTDESGHICDRYARSDERIRVIHTENHGVSYARNVGLDHARGEWIHFIDGDDWIEPNTLAVMLAHVAQDVDIVMSRHPLTYQPPFQMPGAILRYPLGKSTDQQKTELGLYSVFDSVCDKLYRTASLVVRFDESQTKWEDTMFNLLQLSSWRDIVLLPDALYHYRRLRYTSLSWRIDINQMEQANKYFRLCNEIFGNCPLLLDYRSLWYVNEAWKYYYALYGSVQDQTILLFLIDRTLGTDVLHRYGVRRTLLSGKKQQLLSLMEASDALGIARLMEEVVSRHHERSPEEE